MFPMFAYLSRTAFRRWLLLADKIIIKEVLAGSAGQFFHVHSRLAKTGLVIPGEPLYQGENDKVLIEICFC